MAPALLQSGDIRYTRQKRPVKLVAHLKSATPRRSYWVVADESKKLTIQDLGVAGNLRKKFVGVGDPPAYPNLSIAEWKAMSDKVPEMFKEAPAEMALTGVGVHDTCDAGSEAGSDAEGAGLGVGNAKKETIRVQIPKTREPSPGPQKVGEFAQSEKSQSEKSSNSSIGNMFLQIRTKLIAVAAILGGIMVSFPKAAAAAWTVATYAWAAAEKIVEYGGKVPTQGWGILLTLVGLVLLVGVDRVWDWIKYAASEEPSETESKSGGVVGDVKAMWQELKREQDSDEVPLQSKADTTRVEINRVVEEQQAMNNQMLEALQKISEELAERRAMGGEDSFPSFRSPDRFPLGAGTVPIFPGQPQQQPPPPPPDDFNFIRGLRERAEAFEKIRAEDAGEGFPADRAAGKPEKPDESKGHTAAFLELQASRRRAQTRAGDPLSKLDKLELREIEMGVCETRLAPSYLHHVYHADKKAVQYFDKFFALHNIAETALHKEARRYANAVDDMVYSDNVDVINSTAVERFARRLYGMELALQPVWSKAEITSKAEWTLADQLDIDSLEKGVFQSKAVIEEGRKRLQAQAEVQKWVAKTKKTE